MNKILLLLCLLVWTTALDAQECYDTEGGLIEIPEGKRLILIPWWWPTDRVHIDLHGAMNVGATVEDTEVEPGAPCISPCIGEVEEPEPGIVITHYGD